MRATFPVDASNFQWQEWPAAPRWHRWAARAIVVVLAIVLVGGTIWLNYYAATHGPPEAQMPGGDRIPFWPGGLAIIVDCLWMAAFYVVLLVTGLVYGWWRRLWAVCMWVWENAR